MEDTLRVVNAFEHYNCDHEVLILIIMEDTLREQKLQTPKYQIVKNTLSQKLLYF